MHTLNILIYVENIIINNYIYCLFEVIFLMILRKSCLMDPLIQNLNPRDQIFDGLITQIICVIYNNIICVIYNNIIVKQKQWFKNFCRKQHVRFWNHNFIVFYYIFTIISMSFDSSFPPFFSFHFFLSPPFLFSLFAFPLFSYNFTYYFSYFFFLIFTIFFETFVSLFFFLFSVESLFCVIQISLFSNHKIRRIKFSFWTFVELLASTFFFRFFESKKEINGIHPLFHFILL